MRLGNKISEVYNKALNYDDVFIIPKYSSIKSRKKECDISINLDGIKIPVPVIASNMDTVMNARMCVELNKAGALGALHRFQSIEEATKEFAIVQRDKILNNIMMPTMVSIGVNRDSKERAQALYELGARNFVIDIAHGHSEHMKTMIEWLRKEFTDKVFIVAGNVATGEATVDLINWGADAIKCGIGGGSVCVTKNVTGVTIPMISSVTSAVIAAKKCEQKHGRKFYIIADGGVKEIGDVCKAIGMGADLVMSGRLFAGCDEAPQGTLYRGSASQDVQEKYRTDAANMPTPEGTTETLTKTGSVANIVELIAGGLRSAFSYVNARNIHEFQENCEFGIRHNKK